MQLGEVLHHERRLCAGQFDAKDVETVCGDLGVRENLGDGARLSRVDEGRRLVRLVGADEQFVAAEPEAAVRMVARVERLRGIEWLRGHAAIVACAVLALLCASCVRSLPAGAERPPRASDLAIVDAVIGAWRVAGHPYAERSREERASRMVVVRVTEPTMSAYCTSRGPYCGTPERQAAGGCRWGCAAGVTTWEGDIVDPLASLTNTYRVMIWVSGYETPEVQRSVIAHEAVHWLGRTSLGDADRLHKRAGWWGAGGIESAGW